MEMRFYSTASYFICLLGLCLLGFVHTWHTVANHPFHCWPLGASQTNSTPIDQEVCNEIFTVKWVLAPPSVIRAQERFKIISYFNVNPYFWYWSVNNGYFEGVGEGNLTTKRDAENWCRTAKCKNARVANRKDCCLYHVNVHSCPVDSPGICGPWLKHEGHDELYDHDDHRRRRQITQTQTHGRAQIGPISRGEWTSDLTGIPSEGEYDLVIHYKVANMQVSLHSLITVLPRVVCGDSTCEPLEGEDCETCPSDCGRCPLKLGELAAIGAAGFIFIATIISVFVYFAWQRRKLLWDESWIAPYEEIKQDEGKRNAFGSMIVSNVELDAKRSATSVIQAGAQMFAQTASWDGKTCAIRPVRRESFVLSKVIRLEVREVRECDNLNLCKFVGACIEPPNMCILTEYCPKGSLLDVLLNDEVPLNWSFRFSFLSDIARGMAYLHNRKVIHGRLTSSNCVVDDRWTVKISDFGLKTLRENVMTNRDELDMLNYKNKRNSIYMAPEHADENPYDYNATMAGDVYAFAIILIEVALRNDPYGIEDCMDLESTWKPPLPDFNPANLNVDDICPCPDNYIKLIETCWNDIPSERCSFSNIRSTIRKINPSKLSPIDLMMAMMEKYTTSLESIVLERTADLEVEKTKADRLLYSMMPKVIAEELKAGNKMEAKLFEKCTIYFSDIVGFSNISENSVPFEIVALLNKLYSTFDDILDKFNVYKVETIADVYVVVSGIPTVTKHHAREIAKMALELVDACRTFVIPHMPEEPLNIRVGFHSGPACAGVVGLIMPRYCLFGDTMNTSSRMESNSAPFRIHMSNFAYEELSKYDYFDIERRGYIPVKGKGEMLTWWLNGIDKERAALDTSF